MSMESVTALLKDPRKKTPKKRTAEKSTGIQNAIQRRVANGSFDKGNGRTGATRLGTALPGDLKTGVPQRQRTPAPVGQVMPNLDTLNPFKRRLRRNAPGKRKFF